MFKDTEVFRLKVNEVRDALAYILEPGFKIREGVTEVEIQKSSATFTSVSTSLAVSSALYRLKGLTWNKE